MHKKQLPYPLILASSSVYRKDLLSKLGLPFEATSPQVDEEKLKQDALPPRDLALSLSKLKAQAVFEKNPHTCVIGSDQVCCVEGKILGKPHTKERAKEQLNLLQGKTHELLTAITLMHPLGEDTFVNKTTLFMRPLTIREIESYLDRDQPLDCAGSYKLESYGITLFEKIEMTDHTAIIGLPLIELTSSLIRLGYPIP